jgi:hypothetical protein
MPILTGADIAAALRLASTPPELDELATTVDEWLAEYIDPAYLDPNPVPGPVREAGIAVAVDVLQNRNAAGGQNVGPDGSPGPYRMGGALWYRIAGLAGPYAAVGSEVG